MSTTYAPMLWAKGAEIEALASLTDAQRGQITPVVSFLPPEPPRVDPKRPTRKPRWTPEKSLADRIDSPTRGLLGCWGCEHALRTDLSLLDFTEPAIWSHAQDPFEYGFAHLGQSDIRAVPTIGRHQSNEYRAAAARFAREFGNGACIRLVGEHLSAGRDGLGPLLSELEMGPKDVDLVLDFSTLTATAQMHAQVVGKQLQRLEPLEAFRSVVIASSGFPLAMDLPHEKDRRYPRVDLEFWERCARLGSLPASFGDYGVIIADPPPPFAGASNLRYTVTDGWHVWRGKQPEAQHPGTDYDALARKLMAEPFWRGSDHCPGCKFIAERAVVGGGNSTQWRSASFEHHFAVVIESLEQD